MSDTVQIRTFPISLYKNFYTGIIEYPFVYPWSYVKPNFSVSATRVSRKGIGSLPPRPAKSPINQILWALPCLIFILSPLLWSLVLSLLLFFLLRIQVLSLETVFSSLLSQSSFPLASSIWQVKKLGSRISSRFPQPPEQGASCQSPRGAESDSPSGFSLALFSCLYLKNVLLRSRSYWEKGVSD